MVNFKEKNILAIFYDKFFYLDELYNNFNKIYVTHNIDVSLSIFKNYDLVLIDTLLPNNYSTDFFGTGHKLFKDIRSIDNNIPILIYTIERNCTISNDKYTRVLKTPMFSYEIIKTCKDLLEVSHIMRTRKLKIEKFKKVLT